MILYKNDSYFDKPYAISIDWKMTQKYYEWCLDTFGPSNTVWKFDSYVDALVFKYEKDAALFLLTWQ